MLTRSEFHQLCRKAPILLDGATGSNLMKMGMPRGCCTESWVLEHPQVLTALQQSYAAAGSQILYAPTFQAQPMALEKVGLAHRTEEINAQLVSLSKAAAPDCMIAGDIATLAAYTDSWDAENFDIMVADYSRQIRGLIDGGADLLVAETLMYPLEAEAILTAAEAENAGAILFSFTMTADGSLYNGTDAGPILQDLEQCGAAGVGFNCVGADMMTPYLVSRLRRFVKGPLLCKPNAGNPVIREDGAAHYAMGAEEFAVILSDCRKNGATLLGGCCGTDPDFIAAVKRTLK